MLLQELVVLSFKSSIRRRQRLHVRTMANDIEVEVDSLCWSLEGEV